MNIWGLSNIGHIRSETLRNNGTTIKEKSVVLAEGKRKVEEEDLFQSGNPEMPAQPVQARHEEQLFFALS